MGEVKSAIVYITDDNPRYVAYTNNAVKYARKFVTGCHIVVLTTRKGLRINGADKCWWIGKYLDELTNIPKYGRFPKIVFAKYLVPMMPELKRYERIACLDPDTMITSGDFTGVFDIGLGDAFYGMCPDCPSDPEFSLRRLRCHGIGKLANEKYYGAGLIVYNADRIRKHSDEYADVVTKMIRLAEMECFKYPEQDPVNCLMSVAEIPNKYDKLVGLNSRPDTWMKYPCVHFSGTRKKAMLDRVCSYKGYVL